MHLQDKPLRKRWMHLLKNWKACLKLKRDKSELVNQDIMKLYFNGGKRKNYVLSTSSVQLQVFQAFPAEDIGIIKIQDTVTYIDILNGKGKLVLAEMKTKTVKGKKLKVHKAKK